MSNNAISLAKLTNSIYRCTQIYIDKELEEFRLTTGSYPYLLVLNVNEGISQNDISRRLNVDKAMSTRTIKRLTELEYVRKEHNVEDTRAYKLYITDKGKNIIPIITKIINCWASILIEGNEDKEVEISIKFLEKVLNNAEKYKK
ncbi:MarR family winged helix-turn-helix transcriptional regulator [Clostridium thailandense]|uniref:Winged helix-turn-helix transcriptional regulator n=1 Tax=Clostridium thailandense TaxID=2794346 RepID=A0A949TPU1_9CLOT|nr:MarR family winged helix-turn-helix transcriptional regulator [Clostridium thailandense]MBV7276744.1 winged helix-turn-helix transcriptional regulator [Clostridium thailandense]